MIWCIDNLIVLGKSDVVGWTSLSPAEAIGNMESEHPPPEH